MAAREDSVSEFTAENSAGSEATFSECEFTDEEDSDSFLDSADSLLPQIPQADGYVSTEWSDKKHSFYLKSLEASFISQLYSSKVGSTDLLNSPPKTQKQLEPQGSSNADKLFCQFKVQRLGRWGRLHFRRPTSRAYIKNENDFLTVNTWVRHFSSPRVGKGLTLRSNQIDTKDLTSKAVQIETQMPGSVVTNPKHQGLSSHESSTG